MRRVSAIVPERERERKKNPKTCKGRKPVMIQGNSALDPGREHRRVTGGDAVAALKLKLDPCFVSTDYYHPILQRVTLHLV